MRRLIAGMCLLALATAASAEPVAVGVRPILSFQRMSSADDFGRFSWRGGLTLTSPVASFGGISGLVLGKNCEDMLAVSDRGNWLTARLIYEGARLTGVTNAVMTPMRDSRGRPLNSKRRGDAEAVTPLRDGRIAVGFESQVRFGAYDLAKSGLDARFSLLPSPPAIEAGPDNGEIEALGQLPSGELIAIAEQFRDVDGNILGWAWTGEAARFFAIVPYGAYKVTDLAVDGDSVLTLERRFSTGTLPGMVIRRFPFSGIAQDGPVEPEVLLEATAPLHVIDNMEAMALCTRQGETRVTLMSDDNFNRSIQSTIVLQFAYRR